MSHHLSDITLSVRILFYFTIFADIPYCSSTISTFGFNWSFTLTNIHTLFDITILILWKTDMNKMYV